MQDFLRTVLAVGFCQRSKKGIAGFIDVCIILASADEHIRVTLAVDSLQRHPIVAIVVTIGIDQLLGKCLKVSSFFRFNVRDVHIEIIAHLRLQ